jgi:hypothetical protein
MFELSLKARKGPYVGSVLIEGIFSQKGLKIAHTKRAVYIVLRNDK